MTPNSVLVKWFTGPRREPLEEGWRQAKEALRAAREELCGVRKRSFEATKTLVAPMMKWTEVAEIELASGSDIFYGQGEVCGKK